MKSGKSRNNDSRRPTIVDIAATAGVSTWTVSQVLRNRTSAANAGTRSRILAVAKDVGYRPNHAARALVSSKSSIVGIWLRTHVEYSMYYGRFEHYLQRCARTHGYRCITEHVALDEVVAPDFSTLMNWPMDAVIACDVRWPASAHAEAFAHRVPIVTIGSAQVEGADYVALDLFAGAKAAVQHLVDVGCHRIGYVSAWPTDMRGDAYATVMREAGKPETYITIPEDTRRSSRESLLEYARGDRKIPDGLFCENDDIAIGCYSALCRLGIKVPDDVCIVGCDGIEDTEYQATPISTLSSSVDMQCQTAWTFLTNRMQDPGIPLQQRLIIPDLLVRASSSRSG